MLHDETGQIAGNTHGNGGVKNALMVAGIDHGARRGNVFKSFDGVSKTCFLFNGITKHIDFVVHILVECLAIFLAKGSCLVRITFEFEEPEAEVCHPAERFCCHVLFTPKLNINIHKQFHRAMVGTEYFVVDGCTCQSFTQAVRGNKIVDSPSRIVFSCFIAVAPP